MLLGLLFAFKNLDDIFLWQDEANAACLARNILKFGFPQMFDGQNVVIQNFYELGDHFQWTVWPWFPLYVMALFFSLFGISF